MGFALPPGLENALKYTGDQISAIPGVNNPRAPTTSDRNYPLFTLWRNSNKTASLPDAEGDMWYLARFDSSGSSNPPDAIWLKVSSGLSPGGSLISLSDSDGTKVYGDAAQNIELEAGAGISILSDPGNNLITISTSGGGIPIDSLQVQAATAPGVNPVVANVSGEVTINGAIVAAHSVPLETRTRAVNTYNIEAQVASVVAPTPANKNNAGLACYNQNQFQLDATSAMVSLKGSTTLAPILTLTGDTGGAISPTAGGNISLLGGGANTGIVTAGSANQIDHSVYRWVAPSANNWTPEVIGGTIAGAATYVFRHSSYSRIGNMIFFTFDMSWSAHTGTGDMLITGFPKQFALANINYPYAVQTIDITLPANTIQVMFNGTNSTTQGNVIAVRDATTIANVQMAAGAGQISCYGFYFSDEA